jgi:Na+-transporting NADH:ubiquinone oxidoreductase subunit NqrE
MSRVAQRIAPPRGRRALARLRTAVARKALRSQRKGWGPDEKRTAVLAALAVSSTVAVAVAEVGRVWRRGSAPLPHEADHLIQAAEEAVVETVEAVLAGYQDVSVRENATFMLLASFVGTFASARGIAYLLRGRKTVGPFRDVIVGRRHIHHYVPGIAILLVSGSAAILTRDETLEPKLAVAFGAGMGLTLDESALLLELEDVYWSPEGLLGVQITLAAMALMAALALALRFTRRGEQLVFEVDGAGGGRHGVGAVGYERRTGRDRRAQRPIGGGPERRTPAAPPVIEPPVDPTPPLGAIRPAAFEPPADAVPPPDEATLADDRPPPPPDPGEEPA